MVYTSIFILFYTNKPSRPPNNVLNHPSGYLELPRHFDMLKNKMLFHFAINLHETELIGEKYM